MGEGFKGRRYRSTRLASRLVSLSLSADWGSSLVSTMPKLRGWTDVRLLSFDLQTVEFAYSRVCRYYWARGFMWAADSSPNQDYALSITCSEGSYLFSFWRCDAPSSDTGQAGISRTETSPEPGDGTDMDVDGTPPPAAPPARRNAHEDSEQFIKSLLKDDHLSASVFDLVRFLRETIGIVEELERIEEEGSDKVEVLVKAAGWYRILYSNARWVGPVLLALPPRCIIEDGSTSNYLPG